MYFCACCNVCTCIYIHVSLLHIHILSSKNTTHGSIMYTQEHIKKFESAGIGLPELPHTTEEQLKELGIPLGHRTRILQEAQRLV